MFKLVDYSAKWHKLWSMRFAILTTFLAGVSASYVLLPEDWLPAIPDWLKASLALGTVICGGCTAVARVVSQPGVTQQEK